MLRNYFIIAWRNITRSKIYTAINVLSLALGITACLVIYLIAHYEFGFDTFHPDGKRIYRIVSSGQEENGIKHAWTTVSPAVPAAIREEISGIEKLVTLYDFKAEISIPNEDKTSKKFESRLDGGYITTVLTEPSYFDIFKYEWLVGDSITSLKDPFKVVLTESRARLYFGSLGLEKILGKEIVYDDSLRASVSGIVKDWHENTDFPLTDFISISTIRNSFLKNAILLDSWNCCNSIHPTVFVKLEQGTTPAKIDSQFDGFIERRKSLLVSLGSKFSMHLQPLTDIHFTSDFNRDDGILHMDGDSFRKAHLPTLYGLMGGTLFILVIAIVNFINLSTALSIRRAKEIGIRKVLGSARKSISIQFLIETFIQAFIAVCLSILLVKPVLSAFSSYMPNGLKFEMLNTSTLLFILLLTVVTSLLAGFYPAKVLSSYLPVLSLKGNGSNGNNNKEYLRKGLIVFQFTISLIFITGAIVIVNQIHFMQRELSFTNGKVISLWGGEIDKAKILADKIRQVAGVTKVALQGFPPLGMARAIRVMRTKGKYENYVGVSMKTGNEDFIPLYDMKFLAGRNLRPSDSLKEFVINRSYSKVMGFKKPEEALGQMIFLDVKAFPVVGVVEDFHEGSFHEPIRPMVIANDPQDENKIVFKMDRIEGKEANLQSILSVVEKQWKQVYADRPFNYSLLDDDIAWLYEKEEREAKLANAIMMITIFISCIGVFGLSMFSAQVRTREIGIRKVLGATVSNIVAMLSGEFMLLILLAILISSPIAWYIMSNWLQDFAYHIEIRWWVFVVSGFAAMGIALITVSFQSVKAALTNPVDSLRSE